MAIRLTAREAAELTKKKRMEIELRAKEDADFELRQKHETANVQRQFQQQMKNLLKAAICGHKQLELHQRLVRGVELIEMGFRIVHVDGAEASRIREELEAKRIEEEEDAENKRLEAERVKAIKLAPMEADVDSRINAFINALEAEDRFKDLHDTRRMVVEHFLYSIEDYRVNIVAGTGRNDALFKNLFDSSLSVYWPIEQLRRKVQALQIALHKLEQLRKNLPDFVE
jgi:primosomal replication protein N